MLPHAMCCEPNGRAVHVRAVIEDRIDQGIGLPEHAPYDGIVVSAAASEVPDPLVDQLAEGGRIVHPVGYGGVEFVAVLLKSFDAVVPAAGSTHAAMRINPRCMAELVGAEWVDVCQEAPP